jgi:hypothetical protein
MSAPFIASSVFTMLTSFIEKAKKVNDDNLELTDDTEIQAKIINNISYALPLTEGFAKDQAHMEELIQRKIMLDGKVDPAQLMKALDNITDTGEIFKKVKELDAGNQKWQSTYNTNE